MITSSATFGSAASGQAKRRKTRQGRQDSQESRLLSRRVVGLAGANRVFARLVRAEHG